MSNMQNANVEADININANKVSNKSLPKPL